MPRWEHVTAGPATSIGLGLVLAVLDGAIRGAVDDVKLGLFYLAWIAAFVFTGAGAEVLAERVKQVLVGLRIGDLVPALRRSPVTIDADDTLAGALARMHELGRLDLVAVDPEGSPISVIEARDIAFVPVEDRLAIRIGDFLRARPTRHVVVSWNANVDDSLETAIEADARHIVVIDSRLPIHARVVGTITLAEIEAAARLQLIEAPRIPPPTARAARSA